MTGEVGANELRDAVERMHGCPAQLVKAVPISEDLEGRPVWHEIVYIFDVGGHRSANRCYAWSSRVEAATSVASLLCSTRRRLPRLPMQFARRSFRSPQPILERAVWPGCST